MFHGRIGLLSILGRPKGLRYGCHGPCGYGGDIY